jgi:hypothetical protein
VAFYVVSWSATAWFAPAAIEKELVREGVFRDPIKTPPLTVSVTSLSIPIPFLANVEWEGRRRNPYISGWGMHGWFLWTPLALYPLSSQQIFAMH